METRNETPAPECTVDESEDDRIAAVLKWIPMAPVLGTQICAYEQVVYYVLEGPVLNKDPAKWQATIRVFNVWDQVEQTITFKIKE